MGKLTARGEAVAAGQNGLSDVLDAINPAPDVEAEDTDQPAMPGPADIPAPPETRPASTDQVESRDAGDTPAP